MPKAKPTQVIVHRIELQESEREMLELAVAGKVATNAVSAAGSILTGIGSMLAPFAPAFGALTALWIGDRTLDIVQDDAQRRKRENERNYEGDGSEVLSLVSSYLITRYAENGWSMNPSWYGGFIEWYRNYIDNTPDHVIITQWFGHHVLRPFLNLLDEPSGAATRQQSTPAELWDTWYSTDQYGKDAYYYNTYGSTFLALGQTLGLRPKDAGSQFSMWGAI